MNIFRMFVYFFFKSFVKVELSYVFTINLFTIAENCTEKVNYLIKTGVLVIIYVPPIIIDSQFEHKCCCFDTDNLLRFTKLVKCIPEF